MCLGSRAVRAAYKARGLIFRYPSVIFMTDIEVKTETQNKFIVAIFALAFAAAFCFFAARAVFPKKYAGLVEREAARYGLDENEIYAVITAESGFDPSAVSRSGAKGLMQLMPSTAEFCASVLGVGEYDLCEPETNIRFGCFYLDYLKARFDGDNVYAAYNAGEGNVRLWLESGGGIAFEETRTYVSRVNLYRKIYSFLYK